MDRTLIEQYAAGSDLLHKGIRGLSRSELLAMPIPGTWSVQQIALHLMDSDLIGSDRMKRVIAEEQPALLGYNESAFASRLGYEHLDATMAAKIFRLNRLVTAEILRRQPDAAFERTGKHNERGDVSLSDLVSTYVNHLSHHMDFVRKKRDLLKNPLNLR